VGILALLVVEHLKSAQVFNPLALPVELFIQQPRVMTVGTLTLLADTLLVILLYEYLGRLLARQLFLRLALTLTVVLLFDTGVFVTGSFYELPTTRTSCCRMPSARAAPRYSIPRCSRST
jgi:uncharacterized PurR-regulated membrane protein YhhQ (DUF165 family)